MGGKKCTYWPVSCLARRVERFILKPAFQSIMDLSRKTFYGKTKMRSNRLEDGHAK